MLGLLCGPVTAQAATRVEVPIFEGGAGLDFFFFCRTRVRKGPSRCAGRSLRRPAHRRQGAGADPRRDVSRKSSNAGLNYWSLIRNGEILPLDDYLDGPSWDGDRTWRASFLPGSLDRYEHEGKIYGIPFLYSVYAVWYNKKHVRRARLGTAAYLGRFFRSLRANPRSRSLAAGLSGALSRLYRRRDRQRLLSSRWPRRASTSRRSWCRAVSPIPNT